MISKFIAHRGNIRGVNKDFENHPDYIDEAIAHGYDVEIDVWDIDDELYLGHDKPQYKIDQNYLLDRADKLWCHAKNIEFLARMTHYGYFINYFWHETDDYTLTSKGYIWTYPHIDKLKPNFKQILLLFEKDEELLNKNVEDIAGICSDYTEWYKENF